MLNRWLSLFLLFTLLPNACASSTSEMTPQPSATAATPTETAAPIGATSPTVGELAHAPEGWRMHTSNRWPVSFAVPATWQEVEPDHLEGQDGFAHLEPFSGPGVSVDQACEWEANSHRERYGLAPGLTSLSRDNVVDARGQPCLIHSADAQSAILLPNPRPASGETPFLLLSVDRDHFLGVVSSLDDRLQVTPEPTLSGSSYGRTLSPEEVPDNLPLETTAFGDLILEDYTVIDARVDAPGCFEFSGRIPAAVLNRRREWRLKRPARNRLDPIEIDGKPITVTYADDGGVPVPGGVIYSIPVSVQRDGQEIYRYHLSSAHAATFPLFYLGNWDGQWVMEVNGMLVVGGQIVNQEWGYDEIFGCQELNGRPFYFFVQDGQTYLSYGGERLPVSYDYVYHGMCCEPAAFNVGGNDQMVWFYALKNGAWHYVELGVYDREK